MVAQLRWWTRIARSVHSIVSDSRDAHSSRARRAAAPWRSRASGEGDDSFSQCDALPPASGRLVARRAERHRAHCAAAAAADGPSGSAAAPVRATSALVDRPYLDAGPGRRALSDLPRAVRAARAGGASWPRSTSASPSTRRSRSCGSRGSTASGTRSSNERSDSALRLRAQDAAGVRAAAQLLAQARVAAGDRLVQAARRGAQAVAHDRRTSAPAAWSRRRPAITARASRSRRRGSACARPSSCPTMCPQVKRDGMTRYGAELIVDGAGYDEAQRTRSRSPPSAACRTSRRSTTTTSSPATASGSAARLRSSTRRCRA